MEHLGLQVEMHLAPIFADRGFVDQAPFGSTGTLDSTEKLVNPEP
jgi:hypothetical protein